MLEVAKALLEKSEILLEKRSVITSQIARRNGFGEELEELIKLDVELAVNIYNAIQFLYSIEPPE